MGAANEKTCVYCNHTWKFRSKKASIRCPKCDRQQDQQKQRIRISDVTHERLFRRSIQKGYDTNIIPVITEMLERNTFNNTVYKPQDVHAMISIPVDLYEQLKALRDEHKLSYDRILWRLM